MKLIRTEDAAGQVLCHDITQIIPGEFKGARFRKGHIIQPEDIPVLLSIGKENLPLAGFLAAPDHIAQGHFPAVFLHDVDGFNDINE